MADRPSSRPLRPSSHPPTLTSSLSQSLRRFYETSPNSTQLVGILALVVSGGILLLLTGLTITALVLGLIFFSPIILLSSPIWVPVSFFLFISVVGLLSLAAFGFTAIAGVSWLYRYYRGMHPPGSDRFDYARSRIATTAREVKDYAREYGGYLHSKVKDAAPGA